MARIPLTSGFQLIPEGTYVFRIIAVEYDEEFGKLEIKMVTAEGMKHSEKFSLLDDDNEPNEKACNAFSYFAKTALNCFDAEEIDHEELVGHYIRAEVIHTKLPSRKNPSKTMTFANLGDKSPADGFDTVSAKAATKTTSAASAPSPASSVKSLDLDSLLKK